MKGKDILGIMKKASGQASILNSNKVFKKLPKVPMTQYLETRELTRDMLYSGYRPIMYPVKENPLFRNRNTMIQINAETKEKQIHDEDSSSSTEVTSKELFGVNNAGGIGTCGVNGVWRYNPRLPMELVPFNLWSSSSLGMEVFPDWIGVPHNVIKKLRPYDRKLLTIRSKK